VPKILALVLAMTLVGWGGAMFHLVTVAESFSVGH